MASPFLLSLTYVFVGKVLAFSLRFKLYLKTSFPSIFSTSLATMPVAVLPIELLSLSNGDTCFKCHRTFLISSLSGEILASLTYSKINVLKVELIGKEKSHIDIPLQVSLKPVPCIFAPLLSKGPHYKLLYY